MLDEKSDCGILGFFQIATLVFLDFKDFLRDSGLGVSGFLNLRRDSESGVSLIFDLGFVVRCLSKIWFGNRGSVLSQF